MDAGSRTGSGSLAVVRGRPFQWFAAGLMAATAVFLAIQSAIRDGAVSAFVAVPAVITLASACALWLGPEHAYTRAYSWVLGISSAVLVLPWTYLEVGAVYQLALGPDEGWPYDMAVGIVPTSGAMVVLLVSVIVAWIVGGRRARRARTSVS